MSNIYNSAEQLIGATPLFEPQRFNQKNCKYGTVLCKLECFNPAGSVKDRVALSMLNDAEETSFGSMIYLWNYTVINSPTFMRWYEYEITLAPGERIVNTVTAPIYPAIDLEYEPDVYEYTYLLSPATTWRQFGELKIVINTPYFVTESTLDSFEKTANGYELTRNGLPDGELIFSLSESDAPTKPPRNITNYIPIELIISFSVMGGVALLLIGGVVTIVVIVRKRKKAIL